MTDIEKIDAALMLVRDELIRATERFGSFNSSHEGFAVIYEEMDELWDDVKANAKDGSLVEAIQVSAMAARFVADLADSAWLKRTTWGKGRLVVEQAGNA